MPSGRFRYSHYHPGPSYHPSTSNVHSSLNSNSTRRDVPARALRDPDDGLEHIVWQGQTISAGAVSYLLVPAGMWAKWT